MKPYIHAKNSAKKYGGSIEDYLPIHDFMDSSKAHVADVRHRALFHHSFGIFIAEQIFGTYITNSEKKIVQVRDIAEDHVIEDLGFIPTVADYINNITCQEWMGGQNKKKRKKISYNELATEEIESEDVDENEDIKYPNISEETRRMMDELKKMKKEMEENPYFPKEVPNLPDHWPQPYPPYYDKIHPRGPQPPFYPYVQPQIID